MYLFTCAIYDTMWDVIVHDDQFMPILPHRPNFPHCGLGSSLKVGEGQAKPPATSRWEPPSGFAGEMTFSGVMAS
jgi:hypothetical protein